MLSVANNACSWPGEEDDDDDEDNNYRFTNADDNQTRQRRLDDHFNDDNAPYCPYVSQ
jgi:hypothetical protein